MKRLSAWLLLIPLALTGCMVTTMEVPLAVTVSVPTVQSGQRLPVDATIFIPESERSRDFLSTFDLGTVFSTYHHKLGEGLEAGALQAYGQVFNNLQVVRRAEELPPAGIVLAPTIESFSAANRDTGGFMEFSSRHDAHIGLRLTISLGGTILFQSVSRGDVVNTKVVGTAVEGAFGQAFQRSAEAVMADSTLRGRLAGMDRPSPAAAPRTAGRSGSAPALSVAPAPPPPPVPRFASAPVVARFPRGAEHPDDVAVIIGNADYTRLGRDIPDVKPAHADAEGIKLYATQGLGIRDGNVILLKDATSAQMTRVFGSKDNHQGQLFDWVKPGKSRVFVYYSGHGAPGGQGGSPYLIPTDADAARIELNGYPLKTLYDNLAKLPAETVTVVLEACFSGLSPAGSVLGKASPVYFEVKVPSVPANLTVITAGAANQVASWEQDDSSGLFTKFFLKGMAGDADLNKDGRVGLDELERYLKDTLTYSARRHYGRDQNAQIVKGGGP